MHQLWESVFDTFPHCTIFQHGDNNEVSEVIQNHPILQKQTLLQPFLPLSSVYRWMLTNAFEMHEEVEFVIVLEDDLVVSKDFFLFFQQLAPLLVNDDSLFGVRAWSDNGYYRYCWPDVSYIQA